MSMMTTGELRRAVGLTDFAVRNYIRHGQLLPDVVDGHHRYPRREIFKALTIKQLKGICPPSLASIYGAAIDRGFDKLVGAQTIFLWPNDEGEPVADVEPSRQDPSLGLPVSLFAPFMHWS